MRLRNSLSIYMVLLVLFVTGGVGGLAYYNLGRLVGPAELEKLEAHTQTLAVLLQAQIDAAGADVLAMRDTPPIQGYFRSVAAGGIDPYDGSTEAEWRDRLNTIFEAFLEANPNYTQFRFINGDDEGDEIVRVDRDGPAGSVRAVPQEQLQRKGHRDYVVDTLAIPETELYFSPIDLNRENNTIQEPLMPVFRVAARISSETTDAQGIVIVNVDMRPVFDLLRSRSVIGGRLYIVNSDGDFLVHPDRSLQFGFELGTRHKIVDEFASFSEGMAEFGVGSEYTRDQLGETLGLASAPVTFGSFPQAYVLEALPYDTMLASAREIFGTSLQVGLLGAVCAVILSFGFAHRLTHPLTRLTDAMKEFTERGDFNALSSVPGNSETAILADAFREMAEEVSSKTEALEKEMQERSETAAALSDLVHQLRLFNAVFESSRDAILAFSDDLRVTAWNPAARILLGYDDGEMQDALLSRFFPDTSAEAIQDFIRTAMAGESRDAIDTAILDMEGQEIEVSIAVSPLSPDGGKPVGGSISVRDIRNRKDLEMQLRHAQKMEAIGQLAGGIAHDFNNLLTVIIGCTELMQLEEGDRSPQDSETLGDISRAAERASALTGQLLAFSRKATVTMKRMNVNTVLRDLEKMLRRLIGEHIELAVEMDPNLRDIVADPSQLEQILMNLAVNSRDAMEKGGTLVVETQNLNLDEPFADANTNLEPGQYVLIAVSDNGTGMDTETCTRIFEPFFTTKGIGKGTGLGLATVFGIVQQFNGTISCYSEVGHGTTFKLYVPVAEGAEDPQRTATDIDMSDLAGDETILIAEDEPNVRKLASLILASKGYTVLQAKNGQDALEVIAAYEGAIDLLLTDIVMPHIGGRELVNKLAARDVNPKIIYMSGYTDDSIVRHGVLVTGANFIQKPFRPLGLARKVREVLDAPHP